MRTKAHTVLLLAVVALLAAAAGAFAHGGKSHRLLGTVKAIHVTVTTADGKEQVVKLAPATKYEKAGKPARLADLGVGTRVSIHLTEDDTTAVKVKIGEAQAR
jgi:hypothetical protein